MITMDPLVIAGILGRQFRAIPGLLPTMAASVRKVAVSGLCGSFTHSLLMFAKHQLGILESFQPYHSLQLALINWTGGDVHSAVPWLISFLNGSTAAGFIFARLYRHIPGDSGLMKGLISGILGWLVMDLIFFPILGLGPFASQAGLGVHPALFSLLMMLTYSSMMGLVYGLIEAWEQKPRRNCVEQPARHQTSDHQAINFAQGRRFELRRTQPAPKDSLDRDQWRQLIGR
jgi:hypothetical protein